MSKRAIQSIFISGMLVLTFSCKKNVTPMKQEVGSAASNSENNHLPALGSAFSRAFKINSAGEIVGSMRNPAGKTVAFTLKNNAWFSQEEVSPNGLPEIHFSINDPGDVVGHKIVAGGILPVLWRQGLTYDLEPLQGQQFGEVYDINNQGQMVGESLNGNFLTPTTMRATLFSVDGAAVDLGTLGGAKASAIAINDRGEVVGFSETAGGQSHAYLYRDGIMQDIGTLGGTVSNANDINNKGEIVGRSTLANGAIRGFFYKDGIMHDLGTLGGTATVAFAINDKGEIVGFSRVSSGQAHAFLYKDGVMYDLGTLGGIDSRALGINNRGDIVGQYTNADGSVHAFLYKDGQMIAL